MTKYLLLCLLTVATALGAAYIVGRVLQEKPVDIVHELALLEAMAAMSQESVA